MSLAANARTVLGSDAFIYLLCITRVIRLTCFNAVTGTWKMNTHSAISFGFAINGDCFGICIADTAQHTLLAAIHIRMYRDPIFYVRCQWPLHLSWRRMFRVLVHWCEIPKESNA